jgi:hypothetical protein
MTTTEVSVDLGVGTTGISNEQLSADIEATLSKIEPEQDYEVAESMTFAGLVTLARNVNVILTSDASHHEKRKLLVQRSVKAGLVAGIAELLI